MIEITNRFCWNWTTGPLLLLLFASSPICLEHSYAQTSLVAASPAAPNNSLAASPATDNSKEAALININFNFNINSITVGFFIFNFRDTSIVSQVKEVIAEESTDLTPSYSDITQYFPHPRDAFTPGSGIRILEGTCLKVKGNGEWTLELPVIPGDSPATLHLRLHYQLKSSINSAPSSELTIPPIRLASRSQFFPTYREKRDLQISKSMDRIEINGYLPQFKQKNGDPRRTITIQGLEGTAYYGHGYGGFNDSTGLR